MRKMVTMLLFLVFVTGVSTSLHAEKWVKLEGTNERGAKIQLAGILTVPRGKGPFPAVVMLCGCGGLNNRDDKISQQSWADRFAEWGYVSLQVDSFGPRGSKDGICGSPYEVEYRLRARDAFAGKSYLGRLRYVDTDRIAVAGWSHGGWAVMAAIDASNRTEGDRAFQAAIAFYPRCVTTLKRDTPLLILIGEEDAIFSSEACLTRIDRTLDGMNCEQKVVVYPNAAHGFDMEELTKDYGQLMRYDSEATADATIQTRAFLDRYLKGPE